MNQQSASSDAIHQRLNAEMHSMEFEQWKYLVSRISAPTTARIIVEYLDSDAAQKARHAGIYLRARDTVQRSRVRYAKACQWSQLSVRFFAWVFRLGRKAPASPLPAPDSVRKDVPVPPLVWPELQTR